MFQLAILKDTVAIHPSDFGGPQEQAIIAELNKKYANRVLHDVGLCICVFDITEAGEGKVRYGDGFLLLVTHWPAVIFRMVIFRPFQSEVLLAKVMSSDHNGVRLSLDFFDDIYIPVHYLPYPNAFDPNERAHFWLPSAEAEATPTELLDSPTAERMWIDKGEIIRCSMAEQGLGPTGWWAAAQVDDGGDGMDEG
ncbi:polymerase III polypeptide H [Roridomyces roridus]|uniref:Polymerase III polypeptide H n=1 Tax=Roridomyces roridus TaxID=1738132 RepID=A0AAD7BK78_9AGAR|nr:polymerase III polypeptide H [Roridomyces roridus]